MPEKILPKKWYWYLLAVIILVGVFLLTRLPNLTLIPIFTDEAIYLRWAQIALGDPRWRFISLIDGKQPLLIWLLLPVFKVIKDPLVAGRLLSISMGFIAMIGLSLMSWLVTKKYLSVLLAALFYIFIPFFLMYDRLAVYEALFIAIAVWTLFFSYLLGKYQRLDISLLLGTLIGAGLLTKSYANYYLILLPVTLLLIPWKKKTWIRQLIIWMGLASVVLVQSQIYSSILRLSEFRHIVGQKNNSFIYTFSEFFADPFKSAYGNAYGLFGWLVGYLTIPLTILIVVSLIWYLRKNFRNGLFFVSYFMVPFVSLAFFGKVIYPRFLLFMVPPLIVPTVSFIAFLWERKHWQKFLSLGLLVVFLPLLHFDYLLLTNPIKAPLPRAERHQFIIDWPAGYGIPEVIKYLENEAKNNKIIVLTEGTFGLFPHALELYLGQNPNITFKPYWPLNAVPQEFIEAAEKQPVFVVFKERQQIDLGEWPLMLINEYQRGDANSYLKFYRVVPRP